MSRSRFCSYILILILLCFGDVNNSLLSRSKNLHEYLVAPGDWSTSLDELDDQTYKYLLEEVPELRDVPRHPRPEYRDQEGGLPFQLPYLKKSHTPLQEAVEDDAEYGYTAEDTQEPETYNETTSAEAVSTLMPFIAAASKSNSSRRLIYPRFKGRKVGTCFVCGLHSNHRIPTSPLCHDAFQSPDWRARTMARYFRGRCFRNHMKWSDSRAEPKQYMSTYYYNHRGLIRGYYGAYTGGCFKRFLDVGRVYTQRGCRSWWPTYSYRTMATHRYTRLEAMLKKEKDKCIMSPGASLTPFSRSISLFARYHVCVCQKKYCNAAPSPPLPNPVHHSLLYYTVLLLFTHYI